jgi:uncharacterized membrane protein
MPNPLKRFLGEPTHPAVVHFPLALYPAAVLFDILALTRDSGATYTRGAFVLMIAATAMAAVAAVTGFAELMDIAPESAAWKAAIAHMSVQLTAVTTLVVSLLLRLRHVDDAHPPLAAFGLGIVGTLVLFVGGWLGGRLVFRHGAGVASSDRVQHPADGPDV